MRVAAGKALVAAMVAVTFTGIHAQSPPAQPPPVKLPARVGVADGAEPLTLEAAIRLTLEQNNDVEVARLEVSGARQLVRAAEGVFDPRIIPNFSYERANTANASSLGGAT